MDNIALEFKDVTGKGFGFKLKNVSMTLENGYIYAVTGKNGADKPFFFKFFISPLGCYHTYLQVCCQRPY